MPQVGAFLLGAANAFGAGTWVASAASVGAFSAGFTVGNVLATSFVGRLLTSVALSALSMAMAPRPRAPGIRTSQTQTGGTNPCQFILGRYATAGYASAPAMSHGKAGKTPNAYLTYVIEVSDAPVTAIHGLILDGTQVSIGASVHPDYGNEIEGDFQDRAWIRFYAGNQTAADPMLLAKYSDYPDRPWSADMIGRGLSYAVLTFRYDREVFDSLPSVRFVVDGIKLYDPRQDTSVGGSGAQRWADPATWTFSRNPIVMIYTILRGLTLPDGSLWGGTCTADDLPLANWIAAMNVCDVEVTRAGGDTVPRYTAGFEVSVDDEPAAVIEELLKACNGQMVDMGGIWKIRAGSLGLPVFFFSDEDVIATRPEEFDPFPGLAETFNGISATYPEPKSLWESREAPARYNAMWEAEDGGRRLVAALSLPAVTHSRQVQHLMQTAIRDHRRMRRHNLTLTPAAAILEPLDVVSWSSARNGYAAKAFEVAQVVEDLRSCLPQLALREVDPTDYDWSPGDELPSDPGPGGVIRPLAQAVPSFGVSGISITDASGAARRPALQLIWDGAELDDAEALEWEIRRSGTTTLVAQGSTSNVEAGLLRVAGGILPSTIYEARARLVVRRKRAWTSWISATTPNVLTGTADLAQSVYDQMEATARLAGVTPVSELPPTGQLNQIVMLIPPGRLYRWDGTAWVTDLYAGIEPGSLDTAAFAAGLRPVEILSSLPTTGNAVGRMVFLTTDGKLYRFTGSAWTSAVQAADVSGQLVASQIADAAITTAKFAAGIKPVEIVASLPTTSNTVGRMVFLTTDNKLYRWTGSAWTAAVPAVDVTGQLTDAQIAAVAAAKLTGQITSTQISDDAITTPKLAAGAVTANEIASDAVTTAKIAAGAVTATEIAANTITASQIAAGAITASELAANAVIAGKIAAGAISATEIASDAITTAKIAAGAVTANEIAANTITAAQIATGAITADELAANSVIAGKVAAGAIAADQIAAGAVVASKLAVADFTNQVPDSEMQDIASWVRSSSSAIVHYPASPRSDARSLGSFLYDHSANPTAADHYLYSRSFFPCTPGDEIFASGQVIRSGGTTIRALLQLLFYDKNDVILATGGYQTVASINTTANTATPYSGIVTVPAGAFQARFRYYVYAAAGETDGDLYLMAPVARFRAKGELIVDGAITANKISAGAVTADAIAANAIVASKIAAGEITGTKLAATGIITATAQINNAVITGAKIASATIGTANIANAAITGAKIGDLEVDTINLAGNAVTVPQFASATAGSVTMTLVLDQTAPVLLWGHVTNVIVNDTSRQAQLKVNGTIVRRAYYAMDINVSVFGPGTGYSTSVFVSGASNLSLLHRTSLAAGSHTIVVDAGTGDNASTQCSVLALQVKK